MQAQPPGPGLPMQAPSVMSLTFFNSRSSGDGVEFSVEKSIYLIQDLSSLGGLVDLHPELRAVAHAVCEIGGELLHFADGIGLVTIAEHGVVSPHDFVALPLGRMVVGTGFEILLDLPEDPRVRRSRAADHDGIASGCFHH